MIRKLLCKMGWHKAPTQVVLFDLDGKQVAEVSCPACRAKVRVEIVRGMALMTWRDDFWRKYNRVTPFGPFDDAA